MGFKKCVTSEEEKVKDTKERFLFRSLRNEILYSNANKFLQSFKFQ